MLITKYGLRLAVFLTAIVLGLYMSSGAGEHRCSKFKIVDAKERFFTLTEGKQLLGTRVKWAKDSAFPNNTGRVMALDPVEGDKFYAIIDWDVTPENGTHALRWYSKDVFEKLLVTQ